MIETIKHHIRKLKDPSSLGHKRSSEWPKVRDAYLKEHSICAVTGKSEKEKGVKLEIHHILPFHEDQSQELNPENLITLARKSSLGNVHLLFGHFGSFKKSNPNIREDADHFLKSIKSKE